LNIICGKCILWAINLWQVHPLGYHLVNVLLHALNAILLLLLLSHLRVPGGWLAALLFALHPVQVESVAWITERKNVLSAFFYLASFLAYLRYYDLTVDSDQTSPGIHPATSKVKDNFWPFYPLSFFLFLCALLSKTVTCSLPAAILLVLWWKRDRICWRDLPPLIPYFVVGAFLGLTTVWLERHHVGAQGAEWALSFVDRVLVAGRALWFYAGKLVWPYELTFIYPRWQIDAGAWWQYLFPLAAVAVIFILWLLRQRLGKGHSGIGVFRHLSHAVFICCRSFSVPRQHGIDCLGCCHGQHPADRSWSMAKKERLGIVPDSGPYLCDSGLATGDHLHGR
jgi:hypothetical protein